jgi:hypothetical protein
MNLIDKINWTKAELVNTKPRSHRRIELELRLRDLITRKLRAEVRAERKAA